MIFLKIRKGVIFFLVISLIGLLSSFRVVRKSLVQFPSEDGIIITADHYFSRKGSPYILLFHQENSSRGEFDSIAERIVKIGYNCLAVDLRMGDKFGYVENETVKSARENGKSTGIMEALKDISSSIEYVWNLSGQQIILFGSGASASLALIEGKSNERIKAVITFSPGEYFRPNVVMKSYLSGYPKMIYAGCTDYEYPFVQEMFSETDESMKIIFRPSFGHGARGTMALFSDNPTRDEYWLSLLLFFKSLR